MFSTIRILFPTNPFYDRTAFVQEDFLKSQGLIKAQNKVALTRSEVDKSWSNLPEKSEKADWSLGGSGTNVMKTLAQIGNYECRLRGVIGNDFRGREIERSSMN